MDGMEADAGENQVSNDIVLKVEKGQQGIQATGPDVNPNVVLKAKILADT